MIHIYVLKIMMTALRILVKELGNRVCAFVMVARSFEAFSRLYCQRSANNNLSSGPRLTWPVSYGPSFLLPKKTLGETSAAPSKNFGHQTKRIKYDDDPKFLTNQRIACHKIVFLHGWDSFVSKTNSSSLLQLLSCFTQWIKNQPATRKKKKNGCCVVVALFWFFHPLYFVYTWHITRFSISTPTCKTTQ